MAKTKTKRKSMREIRLGEYIGGFEKCLTMFEEKFREEFWKSYYDRQVAGLSTLADKCATPVTKALWEVIEKAQKEISPLDTEYKKLMSDR